ncbi:MAG: ribonuclease HII [Lachnospiraceae bacterium]|nr:ribonuclease HII [Lachnospiraceae bacterium]
MTITEITNILKTADERELASLITEFSEDQRVGVIKQVAAAAKRLSAYEAELARIEKMKAYEKQYAGYDYICGIDEVGRGPLAGPVVACAVILPKDTRLLYVNDSKQLSKAKRELLYRQIIEEAVAVGIGMASEKRIDEINILQATYEAMRMAISELSVKPGILLNDAVTIPDINIKQVPIIKGDAKSISIAAASIVAKVTRDHMMENYDSVYPGYGFAKHSGYGTKQHIEAIRVLGPCDIHRRTFIKGII